MKHLYILTISLLLFSILLTFLYDVEGFKRQTCKWVCNGGNCNKYGGSKVCS